MKHKIAMAAALAATGFAMAGAAPAGDERTVRISETPQVSQPSPFSATGSTVTVPRTRIEIKEEEGRMVVIMPAGITLKELVDGLNALGVGARDKAAILQAIGSAGALQGEIVVK